MKRFTDFTELLTIDDSDILAGVQVSTDQNMKVSGLTIRKLVAGTNTGVIDISRGGTGATTAQTARTNLGASPLGHTHVPADVGADPTGTAIAVVTNHVSAADPHTQYTTDGDVTVAVNTHASRIDNPHSVNATQIGADPAGSASSAVTAHGMALDPHPQYTTTQEVNDRIDERHARRTDNPHGVTAAQTGAEAIGVANSLVSAHTAASDPHPQYQTAAESALQISAHTDRIDNPHSVTATQTGAEVAGTASVILQAHLNDSDPHAQYRTEAEVSVAVGDAITQHLAADNPHPQYQTGQSNNGPEVSKQLEYLNGRLWKVTTTLGTLTYDYNGSGLLTRILGTGIYTTKVFTYVNGILTTIVIQDAVTITKTFQYTDGKLSLITDNYGTRTYTYTGEKLTSITGTGIYVSKIFTYTGDALTGIMVNA